MFHSRRDALTISKYGSPRHQNIGSRRGRQPCSGGIDSSIYLQVAARIEAIDHAPDDADLGQGGVDKLLMSESRVNSHDQHLVNLRKDLLEYGRGRGRIDRDPDAFPEFRDAVYGA